MKKNNYELKTAPPYPPECQKAECSEDTAVAFMRVFNKNRGKNEIGAFGGYTGKSAYGYQSNNEIVMHDQFDYIGWVTRCGNCYQIDLKSQSKRATDICKKQFKEMNTEKAG